jgi:subtilisin family serine protease
MKSFNSSGHLAGRRIKLITVVIKILCTAALANLAAVSALLADAEKISPDLAQALEKGDEALPVIVMIKGMTLIPHTVAFQMQTQDVERLIRDRTYQLQKGMQEYVKDLAGAPGVIDTSAPIRRYKFFWSVNALMATASPEVITEMSEREDVQRILLDRRIRLEKDDREIEELDGSPYTYGLEKIGIPELRDKHPNLTGKDVLVGIIDTGIDARHPEFKGKEITFKDFVRNRPTAYDDNGHGTHVAGTISGIGANGTQIGIAPDAKLMVAKVFGAQGEAQTSSLLRGMEWIANPNVNGEPTSTRPKVVNNSWGGGRMGGDLKDDPFYQATLTWVQLEIFPCFAAGNEGPGSSTVGSPGGLPIAFAIGATDSEDNIARFSSRGPVSVDQDGKQLSYAKPDVSAPGVQIVSAMPGGLYAKMNGTSMATPHATGAIALLYQAKPNLKVAQVRDLLSNSAQHLGAEGKNNIFGMGRISVLSAMDQMEEMGVSLNESGN